MPTFGLGRAQDGSLELAAIGFTTLTNTRTISGGTLTLYAWNELRSPSAQLLATAIGASDTAIALTAPRPVGGPVAEAVIGDLVQIGAELLRITALSSDGLTYAVARGSHESTAAGYGPGTPVYYLDRNLFIVPFVRDFFGSPASGRYSQPIYWPDVRVAAAEFSVTNVFGASPVSERNLISTTALGLRTLSGGQLTLQFDGPLVIGSSVTPILLVERRQAIGEIYAVVADAPTGIGGSVVTRVMRNGVAFAEVTILMGMTESNTVSGFGLPPLEPNERLTIDIVNVPSSAIGTPGRDLTVILSR